MKYYQVETTKNKNGKIIDRSIRGYKIADSRPPTSFEQLGNKFYTREYFATFKLAHYYVEHRESDLFWA